MKKKTHTHTKKHTQKTTTKKQQQQKTRQKTHTTTKVFLDKRDFTYLQNQISL